MHKATKLKCYVKWLLNIRLCTFCVKYRSLVTSIVTGTVDNCADVQHHNICKQRMSQDVHPAMTSSINSRPTPLYYAV